MERSDKRILVVDDDELLRDIHTMVIQDNGYQVDSAQNGFEAMQYMNKNHYDLVATDLFMPEMNGIELILKCQKLFPSTKVMLLSGGGRGVEAKHKQKNVKYLEDEIVVDEFLKKPFDLDELIHSIDTMFQIKSI